MTKLVSLLIAVGLPCFANLTHWRAISGQARRTSWSKMSRNWKAGAGGGRTPPTCSRERDRGVGGGSPAFLAFELAFIRSQTFRMHALHSVASPSRRSRACLERGQFVKFRGRVAPQRLQVLGPWRSRSAQWASSSGVAGRWGVILPGISSSWRRPYGGGRRGSVGGESGRTARRGGGSGRPAAASTRAATASPAGPPRR